MTDLKQTLTQLAATHQRQVRKLVVIRSLWLAIVAALVILAADVFFHLGDVLRLLLDFAYAGGLVAAAIVSKRWLLRTTSAERMLVRMLEEKNPALQNDLINAVEFEETLSGGVNSRTSRELMQRHISNAADEAARINSAEAMQPPSLHREIFYLLGAFGVLMLLIVCGAGVFRTVLPRFYDPFGDHPPFCPTTFKIDPGATAVDYGDSLRINVIASGRLPRTMTLFVQNQKGHVQAELPMFDAGNGAFFQTIEALHEPLVYYAQTADGRSRRYPVTIVQWPRLDTVTVTYDYPVYTHLRSERRLLHEKELQGYRNTRATLTITSNKPLSGGSLTVCGKQYAFKADATTASATFPITDGGTFSAFIMDRDGNRSKETLTGKVTVTPDLKPTVSIVNPSQDSFATPTVKVPINIEAGDDLGVTKVEIFRNLNGSPDERTVVYAGEGWDKMVNVIETLDLADLGVNPGDVIEFYVTVTDSNPDPPQSAATTVHRLAIISNADYRSYVQAQTRAEQLTQKYDQYMDQLQALAEEQENVAGKVAELQKKLQAQGSLTPEDKRQLDQAIAQQQELAQKTDDLARHLADEAEKPPIYDVEADYKTMLQQMARSLHEAHDQMQDSAHDLSKARDAANAAKQADHLDDAMAGQKLAQEKLGHQTENLQQGIHPANQDIEKISRLQENLEAFKQLLGQQKDLERQSRSIKDQAGPAPSDQARLKELAEQQKDIRDHLTKLKNNFQQQASGVESNYPKAAQDARAIAKEIEARGIEKSMAEAAQKFLQSDPQAGHANSQAAYEAMNAMVQQCESADQAAAGECETRLQLKNMHLGNTLKQLARGFGNGQGRGQGLAGTGSAGESGGSTPFDLYGSEQPAGVPQKASHLGRRGTDAKIAPGDTEPRAASIEEIGPAKNPGPEVPGAGGEQFMDEYRKLIEEYFKPAAQE